MYIKTKSHCIQMLKCNGAGKYNIDTQCDKHYI